MKNNSLLFLFLFLSILACRQQSPEKGKAPEAEAKSYQKLSGNTMGTTWHITYAGQEKGKHKKAIDALLVRINAEVSTYIPEAVISQFNQSIKGVALNIEQHAHFIRNFKAARKIHQETDGQFDPTVMPLVNYWGFGYTGRNQVKEADKEKVAGLLQFVGMDHIQLTDKSFLQKDHPEVQIDFSALAKGYGVDAICRYFNQQSVSDYFVEIGGEVNAKGKNPQGKLWTVGISRPEIESAPQDFYLTIQLDNKAIATSGNYRNVYTVNGVHYFHTIDPKSGYPKGDRLLSASVVSEECMRSDAYATALMVMGLDKAMAFAKKHQNLGVCLIFNDEEGSLEYYCTDNLRDKVTKMGNDR